MYQGHDWSAVTNLAWENSQHLATLPLVFTPNDVWETSVEIPYWWRVTTQIWVMTHHQYGISAFVSQTSFGGETTQAIENSKRISSHPLSSLGAQNKDTSAAPQTLLTVIRSRLRCRPHIVVRLGTNLDPSAYAICFWWSCAEEFWGRDWTGNPLL